MSETRYTDICDSFDTCALAGAAAFVAGIPRSHVLINGPLWCYFYAKGHLKRADNAMMDRMTGSQPDNKAVIFGGADFLKEEILRLCSQEGFKPSVLFVENSCAFSLIGDDTVGILKELDLPFPAVSMDCGGLLGGFAEGYQRAMQECLKVLKPIRQEPIPMSVNLLGSTPFYLHGTADKDELKNILNMAGYKVLCTPGNGSTWEELRYIGKAGLNIVLNEELGLKTAKLLEKQLGIPYVVAGLPYGLEGTKAWLERIGACLPIPNPKAVTEAVERAREAINSTLEDYTSYWGSMWYDQVIIVGNGTQTLCMAEALRREWLDSGKMTVICLTPISTKNYCNCADEIVFLNKNMEGWRRYIPKQGETLCLGSNSEAVNLRREGYGNVTFQNIAYPLHDEIFLQDMPLVGITGTKVFLQALWNKYMQRQCASKAKY